MRETEQQNHELLLRRYLLGKLSEEEQHAIEQRLMTDQEYFQQLLRAEEDLIDEYARGEIHDREREEFESRFLNQLERRDNVEFAKALQRHFTKQSTPREATSVPGTLAQKWRVAMEIALISIAVVLAALSIGLFRQMSHLRQQVAHIEEQRREAEQRTQELTQLIEREQRQITELRQETDRPKSSAASDSDILSLVLMPGLTRTADQIATVNLSAAIKRVRLGLKLDDGTYRSYRAELQTVEGRVTWSRAHLVAHRASRGNQQVSIIISAALLTRSDYLVMLSGLTKAGDFERVSTYYFEVQKALSPSQR